MGIPLIEDKDAFAKYAAGVELRRDYRRPYAFGIGAVLLGEDNRVRDMCFPHINVGTNFGAAAAFADVTHHRNGNAVRTLDFWEMRELLDVFNPLLKENGHANVDAYIKVRFLSHERNMQSVVVFVGDLNDKSCQGHSGVYASFMKQLVRSSVGIRQEEQVTA